MDLIIDEDEYFREKKITDYVHPRHIAFPNKSSLYEKVRYLKKLKSEYDFFHCGGWKGMLAYMAGVPYGLQFFGSELRYWEDRNDFKSFLKKPLMHRVVKKALYVAVGTPDLLQNVRHIRPDAFWIPGPVDFDLFNDKADRIDLGYDLPVIFSPTRIEKQKGSDIIWKAVSETRNDFVFLQTDWGFEPFRSEMIRAAPEKMRLIDIIPHEKMPGYYVSSTAVMGQVGAVIRGYVEVEAAACGAPVLCYSPDDTPFVPKEKDTSTIAKYLDRLVEDREFRSNLARSERKWVLENHDISMIVDRWRTLWESFTK